MLGRPDDAWKPQGVDWKGPHAGELSPSVQCKTSCGWQARRAQALAGEPCPEEADARASGLHPRAEVQTDSLSPAGWDGPTELCPPGASCAAALGTAATPGRYLKWALHGGGGFWKPWPPFQFGQTHWLISSSTLFHGTDGRGPSWQTLWTPPCSPCAGRTPSNTGANQHGHQNWPCGTRPPLRKDVVAGQGYAGFPEMTETSGHQTSWGQGISKAEDQGCPWEPMARVPGWGHLRWSTLGSRL